MINCKKCTETFGATGRKDCDTIQKVMRQMVVMFTTADDGTRNTIDLTAPIDDALLTAKINEADASKRWYLTGELEAVGGERAADDVETLPSGKIIPLKQGVKNVVSQMVSVSPVLLGEWEKLKCAPMSFFAIDIQNNLRGMAGTPEDTKLYPIRIQHKSLAFRLIEALEEAAERIEITFQYDPREKDGNLRSIFASEIGVLFSDYVSLYPVQSTYSNEALTDFEVLLEEKYGSYNDRIPVEGLLIGAFTLFNETTQLAVVVTVATDNLNGNYKIEYAAQNAADVLKLTVVEAGLDFAPVSDNLVQLP